MPSLYLNCSDIFINCRFMEKRKIIVNPPPNLPLSSTSTQLGRMSADMPQELNRRCAHHVACRGGRRRRSDEQDEAARRTQC